MTYQVIDFQGSYAITDGSRVVISPLGLLDACSVWWGCMADEIERVMGDGRNGDTKSEH